MRFPERCFFLLSPLFPLRFFLCSLGTSVAGSQRDGLVYHGRYDRSPGSCGNFLSVNGEPAGSNIEDLIPRTGPFCVASIIELVLIFSVAFPTFLSFFLSFLLPFPFLPQPPPPPSPPLLFVFVLSIKTRYRLVPVTRKQGPIERRTVESHTVRILSMTLSKARLLRAVRIVLSVRNDSRGSMLRGIS